MNVIIAAIARVLPSIGAGGTAAAAAGAGGAAAGAGARRAGERERRRRGGILRLTTTYDLRAASCAAYKVA